MKIFELFCERCRQHFYCIGSCGAITKDVFRWEHRTYCYCHKCYSKCGDLRWRNRYPNYKQFSTKEQILDACYPVWLRVLSEL